MQYDINRPWLSLDDWQKDYVFDKEVDDNFLLSGRQCGKTTAMSLRAVELCINHFKKGEFVMLNAYTEKQAQHILAKAKAYAKEKYERKVIWSGPDKPTMHKLLFRNGTGVLCYAAGEEGAGLRGFTIKKLMVDEGSRMSEEYYIATMPMLSVINGSMDIASTPFGKKHKDGTEKFFYKCSQDERFKKYYISAEDCPRHSKEFLEKQKERLSKLGYAQEYLAVFTDELQRIFSDELLKLICIEQPSSIIDSSQTYFLGSDIAGFGEDECTYEILGVGGDNIAIQKRNIVEKRNYTTDTSRKIIELNRQYKFNKIGIDDGGVGFGVYSELMNHDDTKRKTIALNNSARPLDREGNRSKRILKEEMYTALLVAMENRKIRLLNDKEVIASLASIQQDEGKIFGSNSHIAEGIIRALWVAEKHKGLKLSVHSIKV